MDYTNGLQSTLDDTVKLTKSVLTKVNEVREKQEQEEKGDCTILPDYFNDENLKDVAAALGDSATNNERIKKLREILSENNVPKPDDTESFKPEECLSGDPVELSSIEDLDTSEYSDSNLIDIAINGIKDKKISIEDLKDRSKEFMPGASDQTILELLQVARRYKAGEKFNIYSALPKPLQIMININAGQYVNNRSALNAAANLLMDQFCTEILDAAMGQEIVDFNYAIKEALNIPSILEMYEGYTRDRFSTELIEKAEKLEEEGFNAGAKVLRDCAQAFIDTYTFERQKAALKGKIKRKLYKDNCDYSRYVHDFNYRISKTPFKTRDVHEMGRSLNQLKPYTGMNDEDVVMFVILFIKTCAPLDPNNTADAMFMCYSIQNITNMSHHEFLQVNSVAPNAVDVTIPEFDQLVINNIKSLMDIIHGIVNEREGNKK